MTKVFSIYDVKAESYLPPFYFKTKAEAIRALETTVKDPNRETQIKLYPHDYNLMELGDFDELRGKFNLHDSPQLLCNASEFTI